MVQIHLYALNHEKSIGWHFLLSLLPDNVLKSPLLVLNVSINMNRQISPSTLAVTCKAPDQALGISEAVAL